MVVIQSHKRRFSKEKKSSKSNTLTSFRKPSEKNNPSLISEVMDSALCSTAATKHTTEMMTKNPEEDLHSGYEMEPRTETESNSENNQMVLSLPSSKPAALNANKKWNAMFQALHQYKEIHGDCLVPNRYPGNPQLGSWVSTQRRQYKFYQEDQRPPMTQERIELLENLGFVWATRDPRHVPWDTRLEQLKKYKEIHGDCLVKIGHPKNPKLSNWVSTQRQEYKLLLKGKPSRMTPGKIQKLNEINFVWEAHRGGKHPHYRNKRKNENKGNILPQVNPPKIVSSAASNPTFATTIPEGVTPEKVSSSHPVFPIIPMVQPQSLISMQLPPINSSLTSNPLYMPLHAPMGRHHKTHSHSGGSNRNHISVASFRDYNKLHPLSHQIHVYRDCSRHNSNQISSQQQANRQGMCPIVFTNKHANYQPAVQALRCPSNFLSYDKATRPQTTVSPPLPSTWAMKAPSSSYPVETLSHSEIHTPHISSSTASIHSIQEEGAQNNQYRSQDLCTPAVPTPSPPHPSHKKNIEWKQSFKELQEFHRLHGHTMVPIHYPINPSLAQWVAKQRIHCRLWKEGKANELNLEKVQELEGLGLMSEPSNNSDHSCSNTFPLTQRISSSEPPQSNGVNSKVDKSTNDHTTYNSSGTNSNGLVGCDNSEGREWRQDTNVCERVTNVPTRQSYSSKFCVNPSDISNGSVISESSEEDEEDERSMQAAITLFSLSNVLHSLEKDKKEELKNISPEVESIKKPRLF